MIFPLSSGMGFVRYYWLVPDRDNLSSTAHCFATVAFRARLQVWRNRADVIEMK